MGLKKISSKEFKSLIAGKGQFVAIFSTGWCGFCRSLLKELERKGPEFEVVVVDISDESDSTWEEHRIEMVPTAVLFSDGREVARKDPTPEGLTYNDIKSLADRSRA